MFNHSVTKKVLPYILFCTWFHEVPVVQYFLPGPVDVLRSDGDCVAGGVVRKKKKDLANDETRFSILARLFELRPIN